MDYGLGARCSQSRRWTDFGLPARWPLSSGVPFRPTACLRASVPSTHNSCIYVDLRRPIGPPEAGVLQHKRHLSMVCGVFAAAHCRAELRIALLLRCLTTGAGGSTVPAPAVMPVAPPRIGGLLAPVSATL